MISATKTLLAFRGMWRGAAFEIMSGTAYGVTLRVLGAGLQFVFSVLSARIFGAEGYGVYALAFASCMVASVLGRWGIDQAALMHTAVFANENKWRSVAHVFSSSLQMVVLGSLAVSMIGILAAYRLEQIGFVRHEVASVLFVFFAATIPVSVLNTAVECLRGCRRILSYTAIQVVAPPLLCLVAIWSFRGWLDSVAKLAAVFSCSTIVAAGLAILIFAECVKRRSGGNEGLPDLLRRRLWSSAVPMGMVAFVGTAMSYSETLLLGYFAAPADVGVYAAALRLAMISNFILAAVNGFLAPKFAVLIKSRRVDEAGLVARRAAWASLVAASPVYVFLVSLPEFALRMFGGQFAAGRSALVILSLAQLVNLATGPAGLLLLMGGEARAMRSNSIAALVIGLASGLALIPAYGVGGAAFSAALGIVSLNCLAVRDVRRKLNVSVIWR